MLILIHVIVALTSIVYSGLAAAAPSRRRIHLSYGLMAATLASGTWLVIASGSPLLSACVTGLVYLGFSVFAIVIANRRLATD